MQKTHSVTFNFIMNAILKVSAFIFPLITFPYVSRILGAGGNGKITFATSVVYYFSIFAQLGIPTYGIRICAAIRNDRKKINQVVQELLVINTVTVLSSYIVLLICLRIVPRFQDDKLIMIILSTTIILNALGIDWLFQALEQYSYITVRNLGFKILSIILMFVFVHKPEDYVIYGAISVLGTCGSNLFNMIYARRYLEHRWMVNHEYLRHIKPILSFFMLSVAVSVYTSMDNVMLGFISGDAEVGYYVAATKMKTILVSSVTALGSVLLPRMSNYIAEGKVKEFYHMINKSFNFVLVITLATTIYFSVMADATINFLAGRDYENAVLPMRVISLSIILIGLSNITGIQVLVSTNREKYTSLSAIMGALVNLIVNVVAIPILGATGAAIGTVVAEMVVLLVQVLYLRNEIMTMLNETQIIKIIIANLIAGTVLVAFKILIPIINPFAQLCITATLFFGTYALSLIISREKLTTEFLQRICLKIVKIKTWNVRI